MAEASESSRLKDLRVLAVDDEEDILDTIADVLDEAEVDRAKTQEEALEKLENERYDLAILDIMGVNGLSLLTETVNKGVPTIMLTAHAMNPETLKTSITKGALSYLPKEELSNLPSFINDVLEAVESGKPTWKRLFDRLGKAFEKSFGAGWEKDDPEFWKSYGYWGPF
jgi:DNA-binding NtrC family response regulator